MRRPLGVMAIAILVLVSSFLMVRRTWTGPGVRAGNKVLLASVVVSVLALIAAEALWLLRPYAFLAFTLWGLSAMIHLVLSRLPVSSSGHGIRVLGPIVYAGLAYGVAALYLRRVI